MEKQKHYGDFASKDEVLDYICDIWDLFEGEGLEEAYEAFMRLPVDRRTKGDLDKICKGIAPADIDIYDDDAELIPRI
jgi:hypothetical protein